LTAAVVNIVCMAASSTSPLYILCITILRLLGKEKEKRKTRKRIGHAWIDRWIHGE
jgi:hypothetical protein